ncbi:flavin-containing monooxygenase [Kitasatospora purpeofusca]|uniref:flavin-containing monooxygenase n=1 Tax=Kitasatospora purpeofusca TaxID=67352 RepID=UPI0037FDD96F
MNPNMHGSGASPDQYDTCVIGAGPAGLAVARALRERNLPYTHLERHTAVGGLWDMENPGTPMYESAHFISSKTLSGFGGFPMPDSYADYPPHRDILAYLRSFADTYGLTERVEFGTEVANVEKDPEGIWTVTRADGRQTRHRNVVMCSGAQWYPNVPDLPGHFNGEIRHTIGYRSPEELKGKRVLVVGGGNSGCDIACDAARSADHAVISMRRGYWFIPKHLFGRPVDTIAETGPKLPMWLEQPIFGALLRVINGDPRRLGLQKPDHKLFETHPALNSMLIHHLQHGDIQAKPGIARVQGDTVTFTDGTQDHFDLILLATGYRHKVPYAQKYLTDEQHPDLYLSAFSREHTGLFGVGYVETNSGAYKLFDMQAQMIAGFIQDTALGKPSAERFARLIRADRPDLSGGLKFVDSPRHKGYVDSVALVKYLRKLISSMGWRAEGNPPPVTSAARLTAVKAEVRS